MSRTILTKVTNVVVSIGLVLTISHANVSVSLASQSTLPDSVAVNYVEVPAILTVETTKEYYTAGQGVTATITVENPLPDLAMDFYIEPINGAVLKPEGLSSVWQNTNILPPGQKAEYTVFFSDVSQSVKIKGTPTIQLRHKCFTVKPAWRMKASSKS